MLAPVLSGRVAIMTERSCRNVLIQLIFVAKFYGVFYIRDGNVRTRRMCFIYSVVIILVFTACYVTLFLWTNDEVTDISVFFMEYLNAAIVLITVLCFILFHSFAEQTDFKGFLDLMNETENIISKIRCIHKSALFSSILTINYFLFCGLTAFCTVILIQKRQYQKFMEVVFSFIVFHSTTVVLYTIQCIRYFYLQILRKFREIMTDYLALPPEEMIEVAEGNFVINGWMKSVLEKRKDEDVSPIIVLISSAVDKLNTASGVANKIHRFPILMFSIAVATLALDLSNTVLMYSKTTEQLLQRLTSIKALLFLPLMVSATKHLLNEICFFLLGTNSTACTLQQYIPIVT